MTQGTPPTNKGTVGNWSSSTCSNSSERVRAIHIRRLPVMEFDSRRQLSPGWFGLQGEPLMYFPAEHLLDKLQISAAELSDFEQKGIVKGIPKAGRFFYSSRDMYRLRGNPAFHDSRPASGRSNEASRSPSGGSGPRKSGIARRGRVLRARTNTKLLCEGPVNLYLLCAVVSKQTRRLERLMPEERIAELITIALRNCADHEFEIQVDGNTPDVIREAAARMFPPARIANAAWFKP